MAVFILVEALASFATGVAEEEADCVGVLGVTIIDSGVCDITEGD